MPILKPQRCSIILPGHPLSKGLVAYWLMNERGGNKIFDVSKNRHTLTGDNTFPTSTANHLNFNGSSDGLYVSDAFDQYVTPDTVKTMLIRFRAERVDARQALIGRMNYQNTSNFEAYGFGLAIDLAGTVSGRISNVNSLWQANLQTAISAGTWYVAALTVTGIGADQTGKLYLDGRLCASYTGTAGFYDYDFFVGRGGRVTSDGAFFDGDIDWCSLYDRVLTPSEIASLYRDPYQMFRQQPIELWTAATSGGGTPSTGDIDKVAGVGFSNIGKVSGVAIGDIGKIGGVSTGN